MLKPFVSGQLARDLIHPSTFPHTYFEKMIPFKAEYARSARSRCNSCREMIEEHALRIGINGLFLRWHHYMCFKEKHKIDAISSISNFEELRAADQMKIIEEIIYPFAKFEIGQARSGRSTCRKCETKIDIKTIRVAVKDIDRCFGLKYRWHHLACFAESRDQYLFFVNGNKILGYEKLSQDSKALVENALPAVTPREIVPNPESLIGQNQQDINDKTYVKYVREKAWEPNKPSLAGKYASSDSGPSCSTWCAPQNSSNSGPLSLKPPNCNVPNCSSWCTTQHPTCSISSETGPLMNPSSRKRSRNDAQGEGEEQMLFTKLTSQKDEVGYIFEGMAKRVRALDPEMRGEVLSKLQMCLHKILHSKTVSCEDINNHFIM